MKNFFSKITEDNKDIFIAIAITIYIGVKNLINGDFINIVINYEFYDYLKVVGNMLNDLIVAYLPIGIITLTTKGKKLQGGRKKERLVTGFVAIAAGGTITYFLTFIDSILNKVTGYNFILSWDHIVISIITIFFSFIFVMFLVTLLSVGVNNIMIFFLRYISEKYEKQTKITLTSDFFLENNGINIHNYWFELKYVKIFITSKTDTFARINVYNEKDELIESNRNTKIKVENNMKKIELEKEINNYLIEKEIIRIKKEPN